jgi:hypothetical protein
MSLNDWVILLLAIPLIGALWVVLIALIWALVKEYKENRDE